MQLAHRLARKLHVLERIERERGTHAARGQIQLMQVQHPVDPRTFPHVAAHVVAARKQWPEIRVSLLSRHLQRAEIVEQARQFQHVGRQLDEVLDVASHARSTSLHHLGHRNKR